MLTLYRVAATPPPAHSQGSRRPPGNVPYVVDNLWEWVRPAHLPSRRNCAYASPTPKLAWKNAKERIDNQLIKLQFVPGSKLVQLTYADAREHPECQTLRATLLKLLDEHCTDPAYPNWASQPLVAKQPAALLFAPCLLQQELEELLGPDGPLALVGNALRPAIQFWSIATELGGAQAVPPFGNGELFFDPVAVASWEKA